MPVCAACGGLFGRVTVGHSILLEINFSNINLKENIVQCDAVRCLQQGLPLAAPRVNPAWRAAMTMAPLARCPPDGCYRCARLSGRMGRGIACGLAR